MLVHCTVLTKQYYLCTYDAFSEIENVPNRGTIVRIIISKNTNKNSFSS